MSLDLDAIKARYAHYGHKVTPGTAVADVRALVAEVERLRVELAANESSEDALLAIAEAEVERLRNRPPITAPHLGTSIRTDCRNCGAEVWT